ncbi:MAG: DUF2029 domain-containing protein [Planctomycetes bacterium]|nr:DUF2029 domain-containing protein [Planctomycetota bacterium]
MHNDTLARKLRMLFAAGMVVYLVLVSLSLFKNDQLDLYVYRVGATFALAGQTPYDTAKFQARVAEKFPPKDDDDFAANCGFFLAPPAIVLFAPFAKLNWIAAEIGWSILLTLMGLACGTLAWTFGRDPARRGAGWEIVVLALLLNPVTLPGIVVGQTSLFFVGCVALGQYCFEVGRPRVGCFLWAMLFFKPHLAIPFLGLALVLGGWRRVAGIIVLVAFLNLLGGFLTRGTFFGSINLLREYVEYVGGARGTVVFNQVAQNYQIPSWNRILAAVGGPAIDLKVWMTIAGFGFWGLLVWGRTRLSGTTLKADPAWLAAVTAAGTLFFAQVLAYEMIVLVLLAPLILQWHDRGQCVDFRITIGLLLFLMLPMSVMDQIANLGGLGEDSRGRILLRSHRCFGMAALVIFLHVRGPKPLAAERSLASERKSPS